MAVANVDRTTLKHAEVVGELDVESSWTPFGRQAIRPSSVKVDSTEICQDTSRHMHANHAVRDR